MYTTNTIENLNRGIRKYTKTKVQITDDALAQKAVYLAIMNIEKKWSMPLHNWGCCSINILLSLKTDAEFDQLIIRLHNIFYSLYL